MGTGGPMIALVDFDHGLTRINTDTQLDALNYL